MKRFYHGQKARDRGFSVVLTMHMSMVQYIACTIYYMIDSCSVHHMACIHVLSFIVRWIICMMYDTLRCAWWRV